jgi:hypothetical protein
MDRRSLLARLAAAPLAAKALAEPVPPTPSAAPSLVARRTLVGDEILGVGRTWSAWPGRGRKAAERAIRGAVEAGVLPRSAVRDAIAAEFDWRERPLDADLRAARSFSDSARRHLQREREIERAVADLLDPMTDPLIALVKAAGLMDEGGRDHG